MKKTEVESVEISNRVFYRNSYVKSVDLANVPFVNNDMSYAFNYCRNLTEVKNINPNTVNMANAFAYCYNLALIPDIPANATNMVNAFAYCNKMNGEVNIPSGVTNMYNAFYNCTNITSVKNLSSGDLSATFTNCYNLINVCDIPEGVTKLDFTFQSCINLTTMPNLPSTLTSMGYTFSGCWNIRQISSIPNSVINMQDTFENCNRLISAPTLPSSVQQLDYTFSNCISLANAPAIPNNVTNMRSTFANCRMIRNAPVIPNSVINMQGTYSNCYNLTNVGNLSTNLQYMRYCFYNCQNLVNAPNIPDSVIDMSYTFCNCNNLVNTPNVGNSVWNMSHAFQNCTNLINVSNIPNSVSDMSYTFDCCYKLRNAPVLGNNVISIANAFNGCISLTSTPNFPSSMLNMANAFCGCTGLTTAANIPNGVNDLIQTFHGCENLVSAPKLPNNDNIDMLTMTFYGCKKITDAPVLPNVTYLDNTFMHCTNLVNAPVIPNTVVRMSETFEGCSSLINAPVIPESVTNCCRAFANCSNLTGDIRFLSKEITDISGLFSRTSTLTKNVYIPYTYENRVNTTTYNTFVAAGYNEIGTLDGVHLMDSSENCAITFSLTNKVDGAQVIAIIDNDRLPDATQPWKVKAGEHKYSIATDKNGLVEGTFTISDADIAAKTKTITVELPTNGLTVALSGTANDEAVDKSNFAVTYPASQSSLAIEFSNVDSIVVNSGTALTFSIDAMINNKIYSANETRTITENTSIALVATLVGEHVVYTYPFNQTYSYANLTNLVDSTKFTVDETLQALTSKAAYHVDNGTAYGYIEFTTPATLCTVSVTGGVSSESNYDFGAAYIGKAVYTPSQNQIKQGTTDGNGEYMLRGSGDVTSATYTKELEPNTTYFLSFAYAKDSSQSRGNDCLFITNITFNAVSPAPVKYIDINPDVSTANATDGSGRTVLTGYTGTDTALTFGTISEE